MKEICRDLADECQALDDMVSDLDEDAWHRVTPFYGWTVKDQISHLAFFDRMARLSACQPESFAREMAEYAKDMLNLFQNTMEPGRKKSIRDLLAWWREERRGMIQAFLGMDPKARIPWHLPMSVKSSATARLMETWAHGQNVVDAFGAARQNTDRLRHIAHLGVVTFGWSFSCRSLPVPSAEVRVALKAPSGALWTWGPEGADDLVEGDAEDFCLVVTQRRHFADTNLVIRGETAEKWMSVAQCFAGPPAKGPGPGTFPKQKK